MSHKSKLIEDDIDAYLVQHKDKDLLRLLTCGSVDDGKSTLIGRLLHDSRLIYEDQLAAVTADSVKFGTTGDEVDLALLVDGLQAEREQGITIDVAYRFFSTAKRKFIIADTPGHPQYTRNMATGASTADLALILVDARQGVLEQTLRHSMIAGLLGIRHFIVVINKMDQVGYDEQMFNTRVDDYYTKLKAVRPAWIGWENFSHADYHTLAGTRHDDRCRWQPNDDSEHQVHLSGKRVYGNLRNLDFIPISALKGDNVVERSDNMPWYHKKVLMERLETIVIAQDSDTGSVRLPVQYVNRPNAEFRGYCGNLAAGTLHAGNEISVLPSGQKSRVASLYGHEGPVVEASAPMAVTVTLEDDIDVSRGDMIIESTEDEAPSIRLGQDFYANVVWMAETPQPTVGGLPYDLKIGSRVVTGEITEILEYMDDPLHPEPTFYTGDIGGNLKALPEIMMPLNRVAHCRLRVEETVAFDPYMQCKGTGAFIMIDRIRNLTVAAGMITEPTTETDTPTSQHSSRAMRRGHRGATLFLSTTDDGDQAGYDRLAEALQSWFLRCAGDCVVLDARSWKDEALQHHIEQCASALNDAGLLSFIIIAAEHPLIGKYCTEKGEHYRHLRCVPPEDEVATHRLREEVLAALTGQQPPIILDQKRYRQGIKLKS